MEYQLTFLTGSGKTVTVGESEGVEGVLLEWGRFCLVNFVQLPQILQSVTGRPFFA